MNVLGLDPSTHFGFCLLGTQTGEVAESLHSIPTVGEWNLSKLSRFKRWEILEDSLIDLTSEYALDLIVVEGYGYGNAYTLATLVEIGTIARRSLAFRRFRFLEVPPTSLKKFVSGTGNAKKQVMLKDVHKNWGFDSNNDNIVDAYALAQFGRAVLGKGTKPQLSVAAPFVSKIVTHEE